jgi:hypothetical protein
MRSIARNALLRSLVCLQLFASPLLAKPTRPAAREASRHVIALQPVPHSASGRTVSARASRESSGHARLLRTAAPAESHPAVRSHAAVAAANREATNAARAAKSAPADAATQRRVHAWQQQTQRENAALAAVAAANSAARPASHTLTDPDDVTYTPPALLAGNTAAATNLFHTSPELPRIKSIEEEASSPTLIPSLYDKRGKLVVPPPLYGSHEVLLHQNEMADRDGLNRVRDDADLLDLRRTRQLVPIPASPSLVVDTRLPENRRFSRPWTAQFLATLSRDFYSSFREPLQVNSAVRTVEFQQRLLRTNGNAAPAAGDTASPHLTGQAVDIGKRGLSLAQIAWMRTYLQPLIEQGKIDVEEEFQQSCFHISVYRNYVAPPHIAIAATRSTTQTPNN